MSQIDPKAYETQLEPWVEGQQQRINHVNCPAGTDTKERLYIKDVLPHGSRVAHCFNCNGSGFNFTGSKLRTFTDIISEIDKTDKSDVLTAYKSAQAADSFHRLPIGVHDLRMKAWLYKYYLEEDDWKQLQLRNSPTGLFIPTDLSGGVISAQIRWFDDRTTKYTTLSLMAPDKDVAPIYTNNLDISIPTVLTEDTLSAYRVMRDLDLDSIACLGTNITARVSNVLRTVPRDNKLWVWFDGDTAGREGAGEALRKLQILWPHSNIVLAKKSPKEYSPQELKDAYIEGTKHVTT